MKTIVALGAALVLATPAGAQQMDHSNMPGMSMPGMKMPAPKKKPAVKPAARTATVKPAAKRATPAAKPAARNQAKPAAKPRARPVSRGSAAATRRPSAARAARVADPHAGHDMSAMEGMDMTTGAEGQAGVGNAGSMPDGHDMSSVPGMVTLGAKGAEQTMDHSNMPGMNMPATGGAQPMDHANMPGMNMPATGGAQPMDHSNMPGMSGMATMGETRPGHTATGTALPAGNAPAPAAPTDSYADRIYSPAAMAAAREDLRNEHGGAKIGMVLFNLAEYQSRGGRDGFRWDGNAWYGGDINRLAVKSEGEGEYGKGVDSAEVQALYSRAVGPYTDIQAGVRYDFRPDPSRVYATVGFQTLAPGFFDVEGALFLSNKGDLLGRLEGYYDQRITQRLILQPRAEFNLAAQDVAENGIGSGLSTAELGLRLRYEIKREFAPYVGVSYERKIGDTARFARAEGERAGSTSLVLGVRTWF